jgi:Glycosyl hydrolase family 71
MRLLLLSALALGVGCVGSVGETPDAAFDGADASLSDDSGADAGLDAGVDAGFDGGVDAGFDGGVDAGFDGGVDAGFDGGLPAGGDGGVDAGIALYSSHLMLAFVGHAHNLRAWIQQMKDSGYNHIWAHMDDYGGYYVASLRAVLDAAQAVGGITVSPGTAGGMTDVKVAQVVRDSFDHPAMLKVGGKRVYLDYGHDTAQFERAVALLTDAGIERSSYLLLVNTLYPVANGTGWTEHASGTPATVAVVNHAFDIDPNIDGVVNFAVDKGSSDTATVISLINNENSVTTQAGRGRNKLTVAGVNAFYASVQFTDLGFAGAAELWQAILALPQRPELVNDTTANDYVELSYMSPLENLSQDGLAYVPLADAGYFLGQQVRTPLVDHSGVQKFLRPWANAYVTGAAQPAFPTDRMFAWYTLHPATAQSLATMPPAVAALGGPFTQNWWDGTIYATARSQVGGFNQIDHLKTVLASRLGVIRMAAHLTAPAQLEINGTRSAVFPAGPAYFEVAQTLGTPTFAIVRNGAVVRAGSGPQAISGSVWPGGWNPLIVEIP